MAVGRALISDTPRHYQQAADALTSTSQNLITSSMFHCRSVIQISCKFTHNFMSFSADKQTNTKAVVKTQPATTTSRGSN